MCFFIVLNPNFLKADFRIGVYIFNKGGGGFDFSENKEVYQSDPNCDMGWRQFEIPYISGHIIDLGIRNFFFVFDAPDGDYTGGQFHMELNHVYVLKTTEDCYVKFLMISEFPFAILWVYQDDGSRNLDWGGTTTGVSLDATNALSNPMEPLLMQNYPNPFNPTTSIRYQLPAETRVTIGIYNLQGQLVAKLVDERQGVGLHTVGWHAGNLASGLYLCRMQSGSFVAVQKMMLLR